MDSRSLYSNQPYRRLNMKKSFQETSRSGSLLWFWQRISAIILFVMLLFHFISYHFIAKGSYEWHRVITKMQSPWFNLLQFLFLISALYHGLNGVWMVSEDYFHSKQSRMIIKSLLITTGLSLLFIGVMTIVKISSIPLNNPSPGGIK